MLPISTFSNANVKSWYQSSQLYRLIRNSVASDLLFEIFFIKSSTRINGRGLQQFHEKARPGDSTPEPVSVGKCAISLVKILKFPWGVYAKCVLLNAKYWLELFENIHIRYCNLKLVSNSKIVKIFFGGPTRVDCLNVTNKKIEFYHALFPLPSSSQVMRWISIERQLC